MKGELNWLEKQKVHFSNYMPTAVQTFSNSNNLHKYSKVDFVIGFLMCEW